jgi:hypothetical protein
MCCTVTASDREKAINCLPVVCTVFCPLVPFGSWLHVPGGLLPPICKSLALISSLTTSSTLSLGPCEPFLQASDGYPIIPISPPFPRSSPYWRTCIYSDSVKSRLELLPSHYPISTAVHSTAQALRALHCNSQHQHHHSLSYLNSRHSFPAFTALPPLHPSTCLRQARGTRETSDSSRTWHSSFQISSLAKPATSNDTAKATLLFTRNVFRSSTCRPPSLPCSSRNQSQR